MHKQPVMDALYRRYIVMVRNRAMRMLGDADEAQDVAQDVFVKYMKYDTNQQTDQNIAGLLYRMVTNASLDKLRTKRRNSGVDAHALAGAATGIDDKMACLRVLSLVKEEDAKIAVYYYIDGMSQIEIAALLNMPERTVSTHLERFRQRARKLLQGRDEASADEASTKEES